MSRFNELLGDVDLSLSTMSHNTKAVANIRLDRISSDPDNPRKAFDQAALEELAQTIRERGVLQPITLRPVDEGKRYIIRYGDRRFRAAQLAGLTEIPAIVTDSQADENDVLDQVIENDQREPLSALEMADAVAIMVRQGLSKEQISKRLGRPRADISMYAAIPDFPPELAGDFLERAPLRAAYDLFVAWKKKPAEVLAFVAANPEGITAGKAAAFVQSLKGAAKAPRIEGGGQEAEPDPGAAGKSGTPASGGEEPPATAATPPAAKGTREPPASAAGAKKPKRSAEVWLPITINGRAGKVRLPDTVEVVLDGGEPAMVPAADIDVG